MSKKKNLWLTPIPSNVPTQKVALSFKIAAADVGKPPNEVIKIDDDMMISFISMNSYTNGLIMGDKIVKVNDISGKAAKCQAELTKGETCQVEVLRRKGALPVIKERLNKSLAVVKKGYAVFTVEVERPSNMTTTAVGMKLTIMKKRGFVVKSDPNTITASFIGRGDSIIDMDGVVVPPLDGTADSFIRENLAKLSTGRKVSFLVERPIQLSLAKEMQKYIESIACDDADVEMAKDVIEIGREASNMHFIVLKKLTTPSILSSDVRKRKTNDKTSESAESNISISTASTVMKITSDVPDGDELKPVVTKSHAVSSKHTDDDGGMFDSE
ncbi:unnamed protein product [Caenorhabditis nigoni]